MKILIGILASSLHARYAENEVDKHSSNHQVAKSSKINVNFAPENTNYQSWVNVNTEIETEIDININAADCSDSKEEEEKPTEVTNWFDKWKDLLDNWTDCNDCVDLREYIRDLIRDQVESFRLETVNEANFRMILKMKKVVMMTDQVTSMVVVIIAAMGQSFEHFY